MTDRPWVVVLVAPAPLYVALRFLFGFPGYGIALPLGFLAAVVFGFSAGFGLLRSPALLWTGRILLLLAVALPILPTFPLGATGLDIGAGVMLGAPFVGLEGAWRSEYSPGSRLGTFELTLFLGVLYLAALPVVTSEGGSLSGLTFFRAIGAVISAQIRGLVATFAGGVSSTSLPLATSLDPVFIGLAGLGFLGVLIAALSPRTALDEPLPWGWARGARTAARPDRFVDLDELRAGQREALASRTRARGPPEAVPPGFVSLMITALAIVVMVPAAIYLPRYVLLLLALAIIGLVVGVAALLLRRLTPASPAPPPGTEPEPSTPGLPPAGTA